MDNNETETPTYEFEIEMQQKIVALLFQDFTYLSTVGVELIRPSYFDNPYLQNITKWIIKYYEQYHTKPTEAVLLTELSNYAERYTIPLTEQENFAIFIRQLSTLVIEDSIYVKEQALSFAKSVAMREAIGKLVEMYEKTHNYEAAPSNYLYLEAKEGKYEKLATKILDFLYSPNMMDYTNRYYN